MFDEELTPEQVAEYNHMVQIKRHVALLYAFLNTPVGGLLADDPEFREWAIDLDVRSAHHSCERAGVPVVGVQDKYIPRSRGGG